jgi:hypothetical protein
MKVTCGDSSGRRTADTQEPVEGVLVCP